MAFIFTVQFRINLAAKECKQGTLDVRNVSCSQDGWRNLCLSVFVVSISSEDLSLL
jgi:hypothetical protein